ncbi:MAG: Polyketide synthase PksJ [Luteibacter sp.]|nr:MAG: Polyketide synthase PksJ [Luteibacter sp.]
MVLTGRSEPSLERRVRWNALADEVGGRVSWATIDLGDRTSIDTQMGAIVRRHGRLDGVLHVAGTTVDGSLDTKDTSTLANVLSPKVAATVWLDEATRSLDLDFFVAFSSVVGTLGNPGQYDYAAANGFMDAYARRRHAEGARGWRSIGWPLWAEGGMKVSAQIQDAIRARTGMESLPSFEGLQAFHRCVAEDRAASLVMFGEAGMLRATINGALRSVPVAHAAGHVSQARVRDVRERILAVVADILLVPAGDIDPEGHLSEYGLDSIGVANLFRGLNRALGVALSPSTIFEHPSLEGLAMHVATLLPVVGDVSTETPEGSKVEGDNGEEDDTVELVFELDDEGPAPVEDTNVQALLDAVLWREGDEEEGYERLTF